MYSKIKNKKAFGDAVSGLILFIAVIGLSTSLVIFFSNYVNSTQDSLKVQNDFTQNKLKTSISISNIHYNSSSEQIFVYLKNVGENKLYTEYLNLYINGRFYSNFTLVKADDLLTEIRVLDRQETITFIQNISLSPGTHEIKIVSEFGIYDKDSINI